MYEQTLYKVVEPIKINVIKRLNKKKAWEYGYNKEHDIIVINEDSTENITKFPFGPEKNIIKN